MEITVGQGAEVSTDMCARITRECGIVLKNQIYTGIIRDDSLVVVSYQVSGAILRSGRGGSTYCC